MSHKFQNHFQFHFIAVNSDRLRFRQSRSGMCPEFQKHLINKAFKPANDFKKIHWNSLHNRFYRRHKVQRYKSFLHHSDRVRDERMEKREKERQRDEMKHDWNWKQKPKYISDGRCTNCRRRQIGLCWKWMCCKWNWNVSIVSSLALWVIVIVTCMLFLCVQFFQWVFFSSEAWQFVFNCIIWSVSTESQIKNIQFYATKSIFLFLNPSNWAHLLESISDCNFISSFRCRHINEINENPRKKIDLRSENQFKHAKTNKLSSKKPNLNFPCRFFYDGKRQNDRCSRLNNNFSPFFDDEHFLEPNKHLFILDCAQEYDAIWQWVSLESILNLVENHNP